MVDDREVFQLAPAAAFHPWEGADTLSRAQLEGHMARMLCLEQPCMTVRSGCRGVVWDEDSQKWAVCLSPGDGAVERQLGLFPTEAAAAGAYDALAIELWGPSTPTNFHSQGTGTGSCARREGCKECLRRLRSAV